MQLYSIHIYADMVDNKSFKYRILQFLYTETHTTTMINMKECDYNSDQYIPQIG